jgi:hypothetical protein
VLHNWLQDADLKAIVFEFRYRQPTPNVAVPDEGIDGCLVKHRAIRAYRIIHDPSQHPLKNSFVKRLVRGA